MNNKIATGGVKYTKLNGHGKYLNMKTLYGEIANDIYDKFKNIRIMFCDVDGVLSDGQIYMTNNGDEIKGFYARDGWGITALRKCGIQTGIITGRRSKLLENRMHDLGVKNIVQGTTDKVPAMLNILKKLDIQPEESIYIGDDIPDLAPMFAAGISACPSDAHPIVLNKTNYVCHFPGGHGAVREICDLILFSQNLNPSETSSI